MTIPYIYVPIPVYAGKVLKCAGIATTVSLAIVKEKHGDAIVLSEYKGDRILANTYELFTGMYL